MSNAALYAAIAALDAIDDAGLEHQLLANDRTGIIVGTNAGGVNAIPDTKIAIANHLSVPRIGPLGIIKIMNTTACGNLAVMLGAQGRTCSISAACCSGLYNIGHAYELIKYGLQDICITGSTEEDTWKHVGLSADNSGDMPVDYNDRPDQACRPYDKNRQGFVMSAGTGIIILENLDIAMKRGARIYAEIIGYDAANNGMDMRLQSGDGLKRAIDGAMTEAGQFGVDQVDYINPHGAASRVGDEVEVNVIKTCFNNKPRVSSTKAVSGHAQSATASQETVFTILMMHHDFISPTANLVNIAPECSGINHVQQLYQGPVNTAMIFNTGLGGTNACMVLKKYSGDQM